MASNVADDSNLNHNNTRHARTMNTRFSLFSSHHYPLRISLALSVRSPPLQSRLSQPCACPPPPSALRFFLRLFPSTPPLAGATCVCHAGGLDPSGAMRRSGASSPRRERATAIAWLGRSFPPRRPRRPGDRSTAAFTGTCGFRRGRCPPRTWSSARASNRCVDVCMCVCVCVCVCVFGNARANGGGRQFLKKRTVPGRAVQQRGACVPQKVVGAVDADAFGYLSQRRSFHAWTES